MNALIMLVIAAVILIIGYICYGGWLSKQWGIDNSIETPAHTLEDGVDYVPAQPYVVIGHHFSSIAGAGRDFWLGSCFAVGSYRRHFHWRHARLWRTVCLAASQGANACRRCCS